ncbi:MAG: MFS transporter [Gammaproteobacteria bacterium]
MEATDSYIFTQKQKEGLSSWIICLSASLFPLFAFIQMNLLNVLSTDILKGFSINERQLSTLSAMYVYADAIFLIPAGLLFDRYRTQNMLILGFTLSILGTVLFANSYTLLIASIARFVSGFGHAFALIGCFKLVSDLFHDRRQAFLIGLTITIAMFGGMLAQTPLAFLNQTVGWRKAVWIDAIFGILILIALFSIFSFNREPKKRNQERLNISLCINNLKLAFKNSQNWLCGLYVCCLSLPLMILGALWGSSYLISRHNLSAVDASFVTMMVFLGTIIGSPVWGWLSDYTNKQKIFMVVGAVFSLLLVLVILYINNLSVTQLIVLFFSLGGFSSAQVLGYPAIAENSPAEYRSTSMGFANVIMMAGAATLQLLYGVALSSKNFLDISGSNNYQLAMYIFPIAFIASIIFACFIKKKSF